MGKYDIRIRGIGPHHNQPERSASDADKLALDFVNHLRASGHSIQQATFTREGAEDNLLLTRDGDETITEAREGDRDGSSVDQPDTAASDDTAETVDESPVI